MANQLTNPNSRYISGPINVVRLEGYIGAVHKVIYLFMDLHIDVKYQTQCANVFSKDVQNYLVNAFYKLDAGSIMYDFFVEVVPTRLSNVRSNIYENKNRYIDEVINVFAKIFRYNPKKNKVRVNQLFKNIRLHYLDIRDYYEHNFYHNLFKLNNLMFGLMSNGYIRPQSLIKISYLLYDMKSHIEIIITALRDHQHDHHQPTNKKTIINKKKDHIDLKIVNYLTHKIQTKYNHKLVKNEMKLLIESSIKNFETLIKDIDHTLTIFSKYVKQMENTSIKLTKSDMRTILVNVLNKVEKIINEEFIEFFARFTDIFFLRRFLDKDYITNAIVYAGAYHANAYIDVLVKKFNFKITHAHYSTEKSMSKMTMHVKEKSQMEILELILPNNAIQCSNLDGFPVNFQ